MKLLRFSHSGNIFFGALEGEQVRKISGDIFSDFQLCDELIALRDVHLLSPVNTNLLLCVGKNYSAHAAEFHSEVPKSPVFFIKAPNSLNAPNDPVFLPPAEMSTMIDFEAELAIVIGKSGKNIPEEKALEYVLGYTCANDITARNWQREDGQWARGKSLDGFCPLGPWIETELDPSDLKIEGRLNGQIMQSARTSELVFKIPYLIHFISRGMTLNQGTVILTGTPAGCGFAREPQVWLKKGDCFEVEIEGIGILKSKIE